MSCYYLRNSLYSSACCLKLVYILFLQAYIENKESNIMPWIIDVRDIGRAHVLAAEVKLPRCLGEACSGSIWAVNLHLQWSFGGVCSAWCCKLIGLLCLNAFTLLIQPADDRLTITLACHSGIRGMFATLLTKLRCLWSVFDSMWASRHFNLRRMLFSGPGRAWALYCEQCGDDLHQGRP